MDKKAADQLSEAMKKPNQYVDSDKEDVNHCKSLCAKHGVRLKSLHKLAQSSMVTVLRQHDEIMGQCELYEMLRMSLTTRGRK